MSGGVNKCPGLKYTGQELKVIDEYSEKQNSVLNSMKLIFDRTGSAANLVVCMGWGGKR